MSSQTSGALASNPVTSNVDITVEASNFLWFAFAAMLTGAISILVMGYRVPVGKRAFHHLSAAICFTASVAYFAMASDLGSTPVVVEYIRGSGLGAEFVASGAPITRGIWYARYIDWTVTTPLLLLDLLLATGLPLSEIFTIIFFDLVMIVTGLIGALVQSQYKWGFFVFGCAAEVYITYALLVPARESANRLGPDFGKAYLTSALILSGLWVLYPIVWIVCDGSNLVSPNFEMIFYGIVDLLAKPVFCIIHLMALSKCDYARLEMSSGKVSDGIVHAGSIDEKHVESVSTDATPIEGSEPVATV